jgi:hypothetical protein
MGHEQGGWKRDEETNLKNPNTPNHPVLEGIQNSAGNRGGGYSAGVAGLPRRGFEIRSRRGAPVRYRSRVPRGTAPGWAGLPVRESAIVEAQDTHFSLGFELVDLRSS